MEFYSFRHRNRVDVSESNLKKRTYDGNGGKRYAIFGAAVVDGLEAKVSKFVSKDTYDKSPYPEATA